MSEQRYKGWKYYKTWLLREWTCADEALYLNTLGLVESTGSTIELAQALKEQQQNPPPNSVLHDLQNVDLGVVDWLGIAEAVLDDAKYL